MRAGAPRLATRPESESSTSIVLQPDFLVAQDLASGALVELMPEFQAMTIGIHVVYPTRKHLPVKTRRMVDFLAGAFATPGW